MCVWRNICSNAEFTTDTNAWTKKRLFALACPIAALWLYLFIFYTWLSQRGSVSGADRGGGVGAGADIYVSSYYYICARILLYIGSVNEADREGGGGLGAGAAICVLVLLYVYSYCCLYICSAACCYMCVLVLVHFFFS